jgi:hypothetical protein
MKSYSQHISITCIPVDYLDILLNSFLALIITINLGTFNYDNNNYDGEVRKGYFLLEKMSTWRNIV